MVWTIVKKELLEHFYSMKFRVLTLLCFVTIISSNLVLLQDYQRRMEDYTLNLPKEGQAHAIIKPSLLSIYYLDHAQSYVGVFCKEYLPKKEAEARKANPNFTGKTKLDISDRPRFQYREESIGYRLAGSAAHTIFLLMYAALFLVLGWRAFQEFDVR